ncbi:hypothetical protein [Streptomyces sp. NPDC003952]
MKDYIGNEGSWTDEEIGAALLAEKAAQAARCKVPADDAAWPADLAEALKRRAHRNLVMRGLPLGLSTSMSEATVAVTKVGLDVEITRLEAPHRRWPIG